MSRVYNIYCDESCHLENDGQPVMALGALRCPLERTRDIAERVRKIKADCGLSRRLEVKSTKVSPSRLSFYVALLHYFYEERDLSARIVVVPDKAVLRHGEFGQDHDTWYYKMYFELLKPLISSRDRYRIYLDVKDTRSAKKVAHLRRVLNFNLRDFAERIVERIQTVHSREVEQLQLADLLLGIVRYANAGSRASPAKMSLVQEMRTLWGYPLTQSTPTSESKLNIFVWRARGASG